MPRYDFLNKETNEVEEYIMSGSLLKEFKQKNPHLEQYFSAENLPVFSDGIRMSTPGTGQPDSTFEKYVIQRMAETIPGNTIKANHKTKRPKEF
jgi:hypothetical protein